MSAGISETVKLSVRSNRKKPPEGITPCRGMVGELSVDCKIQPLRSMENVEGLYSSIHSSWELASVPAQATSLISRVRGGTAVGEGDGVFDDVAVEVGEGVADAVEEGVNEGLAEAVSVAVELAASCQRALSTLGLMVTHPKAGEISNCLRQSIPTISLDCHLGNRIALACHVPGRALWILA
jgi:hypothetical protein